MRLAALLLALTAPACLAAPAAESGNARTYAHDLKPGAVAEECLHLEAGSSRAFEWAADKPVEFDIHYHQGEQVAYPVTLKGQRKASGKFTAPAAQEYCWMWKAVFETRVTGRLGPEE